MNTESQTVPVSRIIENSLYCDGQHFKQKLMWVQDPTIAPARWLENRIDLRRNHSTEPGLYRESGRIIDTVTGQVLESYDGKFWINRESPASSPDPEPDPELSRWQKVSWLCSPFPVLWQGSCAYHPCLCSTFRSKRPTSCLAFSSFGKLSIPPTSHDHQPFDP